MNINNILHYGIHTYSVSCTLTAKEYKQIKQSVPALQPTQQDYWSNSESYQIHLFRKSGIQLYLSRHGAIYMLKLRLEPCRILASTDPTALYQPTKKNYRRMVEIADTLLHSIHVPGSVDKMKICRLDCTVDLHLPDSEMTLQYIRLLKKGCTLAHYQRVFFQEKEHKAKDCKKANQHSLRQQCKSATFFAYDKTAQLQMINRFPSCLTRQNILRLEAELMRPAMKKKLGEQADSYHYLKAGARRSVSLIRWYLKRLFRKTEGHHIIFAAAATAVDQSKWKDTIRERLIFLLCKTSDGSFDTAIKKTQQHYQLSVSQMNRLLKRLNQLEISPITLPNSSKQPILPSLLSLLSLYSILG